MFDNILVVCTGNICRSPIGERMLRLLLSGKIIDSAGTGAMIDCAADETAIRISEKYGLSLQDHVGKQFSDKLAQKYDLILAMEKYHIEQITRIAPEARGKTMLYGHWLNGKEIPDPYRKSDEAFESVFNLIKEATQQWVLRLTK